ncbi:MAG: phosphoribosylamine--glycine ligase [Candidatus Heimdallarchaeota archaeon]|nr:phosphoribosylamine--glycine ligase [Candidatus Heimdallarchaeota archaeon]
MGLKVLLVGNGAREHSIAMKIVENDAKLFSYMSRENPGIADLSKKFSIGDLNNFEKLKKYRNVDFAIIGPENPLANGITDYLEDKLGIPTCGPRQNVAKIESSKIFTRYLMDIYNVPGNVSYMIGKSVEDLDVAVDEFGTDFVIKPDGLTGGKGVKVYGDHLTNIHEATKYVKTLINREGEYLIEEKKKGKEFSLQVFTDGSNILPMPLVRDYKRAYENEEGPLTGSMGSYSLPDHNLPFLSKKDYKDALNIIKKTLKALNQNTGEKFKGILYGQFMKTEDSIFLIEYNVRFGDPEALNVLKLLQTDFLQIASQIIDGNLSKAEFQKQATVCTYLVPQGYPQNPVKEEPVEVDPAINKDIFYASVYRDKSTIRTTSSRAIALVTKGDDLESAKIENDRKITQIKGNLFYRKDIGTYL